MRLATKFLLVGPLIDSGGGPGSDTFAVDFTECEVESFDVFLSTGAVFGVEFHAASVESFEVILGEGTAIDVDFDEESVTGFFIAVGA